MLDLHALLLAHFTQLPPQSTSDSSWFLIKSEHDGCWHLFALQNLLVQSELSVHVTFMLQVPVSLHVKGGIVALELQFTVLMVQELPQVKVPLLKLEL